MITRKKNILIFISDISGKGGTERAGITLANLLAKDPELNVFIFTSNSARTTFFPIVKRITILRYKQARSNSKLRIFGVNKCLIGYIKQYNIDSVVCTEVMSVYFSFLVKFFSPKKVLLVVWDHFNFNVNLGKKSRSYARVLTSWVADNIVTVTKKDAILWNSKLYLNRGKIHHIPNFCPFSFDDYKENYNSTSTIVLSIGHLTKVKGFDLLLQIWKLLDMNYTVPKEWKHIIVGEGPEKENLVRQIDEMGLVNRVEIHEPTSNISEYYSLSSFLCSTSRTESFGMTLLEAQYFNLPVISFFDKGVMYGPAEIIKGDNGILVEQFDLERYAECMFYFISSQEDRIKYSKNAINTVQRFSQEKIMALWRGILF